MVNSMWAAEESRSVLRSRTALASRIPREPEPPAESLSLMQGVPLTFGSIGALAAFSFTIGHCSGSLTWLVVNGR